MSARTWSVILALGASACVAIAQQEAPPEDQPEKEPPPAVPDLDDLLGLEEGEDRPAEAPDTTELELDRKLSGEEMAEAFDEAVRLMGEAAERIEGSQDVGIDTQRIQEDVIRRLEMIIASAPRQQQQQQSRSSSSQQQDQQQQPQQPRDQDQQAGQGDNRAELTPPGLREGELGPAPALGSALWGALPERVREAISQGTTDRFSSLYQGLTEAYYRRLAEEANR
jgi:hypothetical protein